MSRPGVEVTSSATAPATGVPTDTSVALFVGEAAMGPIDKPTRLVSLDSFTRVYGDRLAAAPLGYDAVDTYFHVGGASCYYMRCHDGGSAATADATALAAGSTANASSPGAWGNSLTLEVVATPGFTRSGKVSKSADEPAQSKHLTYPAPQATGAFMATVKLGTVIVATSLPLDLVGDLVDWVATTGYLTLDDANVADAVTVGSVTLAGGANGALPVSETGSVIDNALAAVPKTLGPMNVSVPGKSNVDTHGAILAHCALTNRVALLDGARGASPTLLTSAAGALRGAEEDRYGSLWAPWAVAPGLAGGTNRTVPWSPVQAALCARNDLGGNPNQACAGAWGEPPWILGLDQTFTEQECEDLLYAGVDTAREVYGTVQAYAFRTLVDPDGPRGEWRELNWARLNMAIVADSEAVAQDYVFAQLDGRGHTIAAFGGGLAGILIDYYAVDALFGDDVTEAFVVNVGPQVNTIDKLADGILSAVLMVRMSPHAELVRIDIVKQSVTVALV